MSKNRTVYNLTANIVQFCVNLCIGFLLTPYIVRTLGKETYGFIGLINNMLNITQIAIVAINSMGSRFITIEYHRKHYDKVNQYMSSLLVANSMLGLVSSIIFAFFIINIEVVLDVPAGMSTVVRITFVVLLLNMLITLLFSVFNVATFATNRLDLSARRDILCQLVRAAFLVTVFTLLPPSIVFVALASVLVSAITAVTNYYYTKKLMPEAQIKRSYFSFDKIKELFAAGVWNAIGRLGDTLMNGLDVVISNILISASAMGIVSISKTIPTNVQALVTTIAAVFLPPITISYAEGNIDGVVQKIRTAVKVISLIATPFLVFLFAYGADFYRLWVPSEDAELLRRLTILALLPLYLTMGTKTISQIYTVCNKMKIYTSMMITIAALTTATVFILLKTTNLGVYVIAGTSSCYLTILDLFIAPIFAAKCINKPVGVFYPQIIKHIFLMAGSIVISIGMRQFLSCETWPQIIVAGIINSIVVTIFNGIFLVRQEEISHIKFMRKKS